MLLPHDITTALYHIGQFTTWSLPQDRLPHSLPQYHTEYVWYVWYSGTINTGLIGILPQRYGRHYHAGHIYIVPHRSDRHYHRDLIDHMDSIQQPAIHVWCLWYITTWVSHHSHVESNSDNTPVVFCMVTPGTTGHITLSHGYHSQLFTLPHKSMVHYRLRPVVSNIPVVFVW